MHKKREIDMKLGLKLILRKFQPYIIYRYLIV